MRKQIYFANPAISGPRQLRFHYTRDPRGYWGSIRDDIPGFRLREMLEAISVDRLWLDDPCELAISMALGRHPTGYSMDTVRDLLGIVDHESLYPTHPNRVLHGVARSIRGELIADAHKRGMAIDMLPRSHHAAWFRRINGHMSAPPWLSNLDVLDLIEKNVRMRIWEMYPKLQEAEEIEYELYHLTTKIFLATGWHLLFDPGSELPPEHALPSEVVRMIQRGQQLEDRFNAINWNEFIDNMIFPRFMAECSQEGGWLVATDAYRFVDTDDYEAYDVDIIYDLVHSGDPHLEFQCSLQEPTAYGCYQSIVDFLRRVRSHSRSPATAAASP